jgi:RNA polymerase sigma-70 factor (ECF subfamily)
MSTLEVAPPDAPAAPGGAAELILSGLFQRHSHGVYRFCARRLRTPDEAEDALQTTFLHAFRALRRGVVPVCESAWLYKIAENVCLSAYRSTGRRGKHELVQRSELLDYLPARQRESGELLGLSDALDGLPENQRSAFVLRELNGLSYGEIAAHLDVTVASVEALLVRARRGLAHSLEGGIGLRSRARAALDAGPLLGTLKAALGGAASIKLVSAVALVVAATAPAGDAPPAPADRQTAQVTHQRAPAAPPRATRLRTVDAKVVAAVGSSRGSAERAARPTRPTGMPRRSLPRPERAERPPAPDAVVAAPQPAETPPPAQPDQSPPASAPAPPPPSISLPPTPLPTVPDLGLPDPTEVVPDVPSIPSSPPGLPVAAEVNLTLPQIP